MKYIEKRMKKANVAIEKVDNPVKPDKPKKGSIIARLSRRKLGEK